MKGLIIILMTSVLVNNYVLVRFLGICPFLGVSKKLNQAFGMGVAVTFVMLMATAATYPIYSYLLEPNGLGYMRTIVFILVIAALVQLVEIILKKYIPALHASLGIYLPLITTNCAVLGLLGIGLRKVDLLVGEDSCIFRCVDALELDERYAVALEAVLLDEEGNQNSIHVAH